ncbi:hypothetical protein BKA66DRAFT_424530 [Pyrenochaeta sp. MPI-SDFR-AT-0127]|nr:hypothetical protein BKA66DRAFT_424530 [Pyrenochaeta sp. MPI-SDFR-AT-0127]
MESLVALGFAANVVQFVEFATKVISQTIKIHRAAAQSEDQVLATDLYHIQCQLEDSIRPIDLEKSVKETLNGKIVVKEQAGFKSLLTRSRTINFLHHQSQHQNILDPTLLDEEFERQEELNSAKVATLSACDRDILRVCAGCQEIANELQAALTKLKSSKTTLWPSFLEALRTVWSQEEIQSLRQRLDSYRQQMTVLLLVSLREKVQGSRMAQDMNNKDLFENTQRIRNRLDHLFLAQERWKSEVIRAVQEDHLQQDKIVDSRTPRGNSLQQDLTADRKVQFHKALLRWVCFTELDLRYEKIAKAYEETFQWIYHSPPSGSWSDFRVWLEDEDEQLYWITGKPAAGKSTLLKFIYNDPHTAQYLTKWAGGKKLIKCAFYFWNSGTEIQMSEEGMIRTLLHAALRQAPELWSTLFPSKMEEYILFADPWKEPITLDEVKRAFRLLVDGAGDDYKLFFFIDGLDEFGGNHEALVAMIQSLISPHIKTCVSSRAWPVFEDGFQQRPSLRLEVLTYKDIKHYVTSRFLKSKGFQERRQETPLDADQLIEAVTLKASGVFLWVQLVTDSLLKGLAAGDQLDELYKRLDEVPIDLEELFWKMLTYVEEAHRIHMSQILQIMRGSIAPLTLLDFSYADDPDPEVVSKVSFGTPNSQQVDARASRMRRRIKTCCKGLIESEPKHEQPLSEASVTYLHRTVRDYLERDGIWSQFLAMTDDTFNLASRLFNTYAVHLKMRSVEYFEMPQNAGLKYFWEAVLYAIQYSIQADPANKNGLQYKYLVELDEIATHLAGLTLSKGVTLLEQYPTNKTPLLHWSGSRKGGQFNTSFEHLAIQLQLKDYIEHATLLKQKSQIIPASKNNEVSINLLLATLHYDVFVKDVDVPRLDVIPSTPSADLVALFLTAGADPNGKIDGALTCHGNITGAYSPWETHLRESDRETQIWADISRVYLKYGADPTPVLASASYFPQSIVALARAREKEMQKTAKRQKAKRFGSIFRVRRTDGSGNARVPIT